MKVALRILAGIAVLLAVFACAVILFTFTPLSSTGPGQAFQGLMGQGQNAATNAALDATGLKTQADEALRGNAADIAAATGMSEEQVDQAIDELDIENWQVISLPADAQPAGTQEVSYGGVSATLTTYADPSYVTLETHGQTFTLSVPESAQQYLPFLGYL